MHGYPDETFGFRVESEPCPSSVPVRLGDVDCGGDIYRRDPRVVIIGSVEAMIATGGAEHIG